MAYGFVFESHGKDVGLTVDKMWVTYTEELDFEQKQKEFKLFFI